MGNELGTVRLFWCNEIIVVFGVYIFIAPNYAMLKAA